MKLTNEEKTEIIACMASLAMFDDQSSNDLMLEGVDLAFLDFSHRFADKFIELKKSIPEDELKVKLKDFTSRFLDIKLKQLKDSFLKENGYN